MKRMSPDETARARKRASKPKKGVGSLIFGNVLGIGQGKSVSKNRGKRANKVAKKAWKKLW